METPYSEGNVTHPVIIADNYRSVDSTQPRVKDKVKEELLRLLPILLVIKQDKQDVCKRGSVS